jgi:uncharacterized iron-regulated protein
VLAVCLCLAGATVTAASESEWRAWAAEAHKRHVLAGRVYDVALGRLSDTGDGSPLLPEGLALLGEVHDNPMHHRVRAWLIADALRARPGWRPAVVLEQIDTDQQPALDRYAHLLEHDRQLPAVGELFRLLGWEKSGWPAAEIYMPLFKAVTDARLPMLPGSVPRVRVRSVARGGLLQIAAEERARLGLDRPLPGPLADALRRELEESHCGALPPQAMGGMAAAQLYRDAHMADALLAAAQRHGSAILIAGNGHVRADRGVPWHLSRRAPGTAVITVLLLEVEDGKTEPADYLPRDPNSRPPADFVIFTPRAERADPCEALRKK